MKYESDMITDKLRGHIYKMSRWQYAEVKEQIDPELKCTVYQTINEFTKDPKNIENNTFNPWKLVAYLVSSVSSLLMHRLAPDKHFLDPRPTIDYAFGAYKHMSTFTKTDDMCDIADMVVIYIVQDVLAQIRFHTRYNTTVTKYL